MAGDHGNLAGLDIRNLALQPLAVIGSLSQTNTAAPAGTKTSPPALEALS